ncbi:RNA-binding S4 domain-containing protein, partial [Corynebacterium sp. HMSC071B10]|uniref:RNA-binding S4 domain-containing protein n=2 Tax=Corynebacterium TaxID=1716 RepID=UPI0008A238A7
MDVAISGDSIRLGQFLKLANLVESGGHAKEVIAAGEVKVNGEVVTSRGFSLVDADVVHLAGASATVVTG